MTAIPRDEDWREADYLAFERSQTDARHEWVDGQVRAMSGSSREHDLIKMALSLTVQLQLADRPCTIHSSDMRVRIGTTGDHVYPDLSVVCGEAIYADDHVDALTNPVAVFEVLSPSTEGYDRGKKRLKYQGITTLQDYVLIAQDEPLVERYSRRDDGWVTTHVHGLGATLAVPSVGITLALSDLYKGVTF
jgi:Uma2 family endonuclease